MATNAAANDASARKGISLADLADLPADELERFDIAALNLLCAAGLPDAETLPIDELLAWIDDAARQVRLETDRNAFKFLIDPSAFDGSHGKFCAVCLVTVLQQRLGVRYNPNWQHITPENPVDREFGRSAADLFIHPIIDGRGGTCGSLPVLYVAVGRRLGYPLRLVKAFRHLFVRWDDSEGKHWRSPARFNIEATGPGVHFLPDDHYRTWPHPLPDAAIESGVFLRSLSRREELAEFVATRAHCLVSNEQLREALSAYTLAAHLVPNNPFFVRSQQELTIHLAVRRRGHAFLNAPVPCCGEWPEGPVWISRSDGEQVMVQVVDPFQPVSAASRMELVRGLHRQQVQSPNGMTIEVQVPVQNAAKPLEAHWLQLPDGKYALVHMPIPFHRRFFSDHQAASQFSVAQPVVPLHRTRDPNALESDPLALLMPFQGAQDLIVKLQEVQRERQVGSACLPLGSDGLALPAGPGMPRLDMRSR